MQDRSPSHFAVVICEWLNAQFSRKWIGRRGSHEWPAQNPDVPITPWTYFFIWGCLKEHVYSTKSRYLEEIGGRMQEIL